MKRLTYKAYLESRGDTMTVARLEPSERNAVNSIITEPGDKMTDALGMPVYLSPDRHYLVGEIADRLYAYEQLGYSPEELQKIVEEHKRLTAVTKTVADCKTMVEFKNGSHIYLTTARQNGKTNLQLQIYKHLLNSLYGSHADESLQIENVIFNDPATIVFWKDGTKTVVKATNEDFDPEKGLAMAIAKKALGNKHDYYNVFKKRLKKWKKSKED